MKALLLLIIVNFLCSTQELNIQRIMSKPYLWGERVSAYHFSGDGQYLYFQENGKITTVNLSSLQKIETDSSITSIPSNWVNDSIFIQSANKSYHVKINKANKFLTYTKNLNTLKGDDFLLSADLSTQLILVNKTAIISRGQLITRINCDDEAGDYTVQLDEISSNGRYFTFRKSKLSTERNYDVYFPDYLGSMTQPGKQTRGFRENELWLADIVNGTIKLIYKQKEGGYIGDIQFSANSEFLVFSDHPIERKTIQYFIYFPKTNTLNTIYKAASTKWVEGSYSQIRISPNNEKIAFIALADMHETLFVHDIKSKRNEHITKFKAEIIYAEWLNNQEILYISNEKSPLERHIFSVDIHKQIKTQLSSTDGYIRSPRMDKNRNFIAFQYSTLAVPDELFLFDIRQRKYLPISQTIPNEFKQLTIIKPDLISVKSRDKQFDIYANFYHKDNEKRPLIVFVHGAGILQNVLNGWTPAYHREFLFHQFLMQSGYHVIDVDYRGSMGYSHAFSTDVHSHLGKRELEDIVSIIDDLTSKNLIDRDRVGIYGGSYGGFMAAYALEFEPKLFKAAAALRSVFKWENYYVTNEWYTRARLGHLKENPDWYKRSSPIYHTDRIENPLLILHGVIDDNVPFQDAVQMVQDMIDRGKTFELMIYPKEKHSFVYPSSWIDEYQRIFQFFERNVKGLK